MRRPQQMRPKIDISDYFEPSDNLPDPCPIGSSTQISREAHTALAILGDLLDEGSTISHMCARSGLSATMVYGHLEHLLAAKAARAEVADGAAVGFFSRYAWRLTDLGKAENNRMRGFAPAGDRGQALAERLDKLEDAISELDGLGKTEDYGKRSCRQAELGMWAVTTREANGRVFVNSLELTAKEADLKAGDCGPRRKLSQVLVVVTTDLDADISLK